jgi:hypothetical protein
MARILARRLDDFATTLRDTHAHLPSRRCLLGCGFEVTDGPPAARRPTALFTIRNRMTWVKGRDRTLQEG